jgi:hypothetical protein
MNYADKMGLGVMKQTKFHKDWFRHFKVNGRGGGNTHIDTQTNISTQTGI